MDYTLLVAHPLDGERFGDDLEAPRGEMLLLKGLQLRLLIEPVQGDQELKQELEGF